MSLYIKLLLSAVISAVLVIGGIFTGQKLNTPIIKSAPTLGSAFSPVQGQTYTLSGSGVIATATTIPLTSFTTPDGRPLVMSMFGNIGYGTLDPNSPNRIEDVTFTGITQNANGTAVLTGVSRGMDFVTPYLASSTLAQAHAGGSYFILSNTAGFYGQQFLFANGNSTSTATMVFSSTTPPRYDGDPIWLNFTGTVLADVNYVNSVVAAGAANASQTVKGIIQIATAIQTAAGTATGSTGALLVPPNSLYNATQSATTIIPVTNTSGKLSQAFLDLTQAFTFIGPATFNGATTTNFSIGNYLKWNGVTYTINGTQGASSTLLQTNGNGNLTWEPYGLNIGTTTASTSPTITNGATSPELTFASITVPANTLGTNNSLVWDVPISSIICTSTTNGCTTEIKIKYGGTTVYDDTFGVATTFLAQVGRIRFRLIGNGVTNSQYADTSFFTNTKQTSFAATGGYNDFTTGASTVDSTVNQTLTMTVIIFANSGMSSSMAIGAGTVTVSK